jgi:chemotaxis protein MotB
MSRKHKHEEHTNHEAWAIPYGDLITLLLAFFVVMYAISTVNEGKYRALSDSLSSAFSGAPRAPAPIQVGEKNIAHTTPGAPLLAPEGNLIGQHASLLAAAKEVKPEDGKHGDDKATPKGMSPLDELMNDVEAKMADEILQDVMRVRRKSYGIEVDIRTDVLFPSGSATMAVAANGILQRLADTLKPLPYPLRVEGHTDNVPINTPSFRSNWELSAARAASVVRLFTQRGIDPARLAVIGLGEFRPVADNATEKGRNLNRRVMVVILNNGDTAEGSTQSTQPGQPTETADAGPPASL